MDDITAANPQMILIVDGPKVYGKMTRADAETLGIPEAAIVEAETRAAQDQARQKVRSKIEDEAGDTLSMLGTTSDAAAIATLGIAALTVAVASSSDYAKFKTAFMGALQNLAGDHDMVEISGSFLAKIEAGEVILPAMAKGIGEVIADIETRSTAVSQALIAAKS